MAEMVTIEKYVTELRQKSKDCEFGASENDMIRDKIVFNLNDQILKQRLLRESNLTLEKAIDLCRAAETAKAQIQAMTTTGQERAIHAVNKTKGKDIQQWKQGRRQQKTTTVKEEIRRAGYVESLIHHVSVQHLGCRVESVVSPITEPRCVIRHMHHIRRLYMI